MASRDVSPATITATSADEKQRNSDESDDVEPDEEGEATSAQQEEEQEEEDNDDGTFTTLLFSDRGTTLPHWTVEADEEFNKILRERSQLSTLNAEGDLTVKQLQVIFDNYRKCIITNTLETYLIFLSWVSHIHDIDDDDERVAQGAALQDFIRDVEHISDKGEGKKGSLSAVGNRIIVAAYIWLHNRVWEWWDQHRSRVSVKMIASCTVKAVTDQFLLGRLIRILMMNEHKTKAEVSQLAKDIVDEDGIAAWDIKKGTLIFHAFHSDDWVEATAKQAKERQWVKAATLREHKRWIDICDKKEKAIRALTIISIGAEAKKVGGVDTFEVQFSNKESLWLSQDNLRALSVKQWTRVLDADDAMEVEEKKEEAKERPQMTLEQRKMIAMEEKLKEEHRLRVHEHQLRIQAEEQLQLLLREREKEHAEQQRRQRLQHREKARETAQLLDKLGELSARMDNELRQEVLQLVRALQGKALEEPAEEAKEAPQLPAAADQTEEAKQAPSDEGAAVQEAQANVDAAEDDAEGDAAEDDAPAAAPPLAGVKRKQAVGKAKASKKRR